MSDADKKEIPALKLDYVNDDCCIVQVVAETTTAGGLVIPDSAQGGANTGLVLAHGYNIGINDEDDEPLNYVGQTAVFVPGTGKKMKINGVEVLALHKAELIGIHVVD